MTMSSAPSKKDFGMVSVLAGDRLNLFFVFLDMKQVDARQDGDPVAQKFLHILPTKSVPASRRILSGERVNDADLWRAEKNRIQIDCLTVGCLELRNHFQFLQERLDVFGLLSLNSSNDNVFAALSPPPGFVQHAIGLPDARRIAEKNLEFRTPALALLGLYLFEEPFWTWPC
jgi:hypothetical protein